VSAPYYADAHLTVYQGDAHTVLADLPAESVHCVVTSPPYWGLRDYGVPGQLGLEPTPEEYVAALVDVFREVRRVLRADGTVWLNLGDSYISGQGGRQTAAGQLRGTIRQDRPTPHARPELDNAPSGWAERAVTPRTYPAAGNAYGWKPKDLAGIPWRVAFALQADGWYLRSDIIWSKPNPMPESVTDRPTKSHEYVFLLSRSPRYYFDADAVREAAEAAPQRRLTAVSEQPGAAGRIAAGGHNPMSQGGAPTKRDKQSALGKGTYSGFNGRWDASVENGTAPLGRNLRSVWTIATEPYPGAHFATFPRKLVEPCVKAGCPEGGVVLDPFAGTGTVGLVAQHLGRRAVLIDLSADYLVQCLERNRQVPLGLGA